MRLRIVGLLGLLALAAPLAFAQTTGSISGVARDSNGTPLPGVLISIVSPVLPLGRTATSRSDGVFQFFNLTPGTYQLKADLQGLASFSQEVIVQLTKDTEVYPVLRATTAEVVTVMAAAPLVDTKASDVSVVTTRKTMEKLPLARTFSGTFQLAPGIADSGVAISNTNIGVNAAGGRQDNTFLYDGVNVTNPFFGDLYQDFAELDIQEVNITRSGVTADNGRTGGFIVNGVTKSGTNNFHGEARLEYQPAAFEADSKDPNLQSTTERFRPGVGIGGPIVKDYLFAYTSANFYRLTQSDRVNDLGPIPNSDLDINEYFFKLSATPAQNMLFDASYRYRSINQSYANVGAFDAASTADNTKELNRVGLFSWYWTATQNFNLEAKFSVNDNPSGSIPVTPLGYQGVFNAADPSQSGYYCNGITCTGASNVATNTDSFTRYNYNITGSYLANFVGASHLIKAGAYFSNNKENKSTIANGWGTITNSTNSNCGTDEGCYRARYSPFQNPQISRGQTIGIFLQDQATWDRLTLNIGFLMNQDTFIPNDNKEFTYVQGDFTVPNDDLLPCTDPAHLAAACTYTARQVFSFGSQFQPRVGVAYEVTPSIHDKVYANFGRYSNMDNQSFARAAAPLRLYRVDAYFNSTTGAFITDVVRGNNTGKIVLPDIKPMYTDEFSVGYARPLGGGWVGEIYGLFRNTKNIIEDFPATGLADNPDNFRYGNIPAHRKYQGGTIEVKRAGVDNWTLDASYTLSKLTGNWDLDYATQLFYTSSYIQDGPRLYVEDPNRQGTLIGNRTHVAKIFSSYTFPFHTTFGGYLRYQSGRPWEAREFDPIYGTDYAYAEPAGSRTTPSWTNFDLLVSQTIPIGPTNLVIEGRVFNLFNSQPALTVDQDLFVNDDNTGANPNFGRATSYAPPRGFVISATFNF